jgi:hypothetical protein
MLQAAVPSIRSPQQGKLYESQDLAIEDVVATVKGWVEDATEG